MNGELLRTTEATFIGGGTDDRNPMPSVQSDSLRRTGGVDDRNAMPLVKSESHRRTGIDTFLVTCQCIAGGLLNECRIAGEWERGAAAINRGSARDVSRGSVKLKSILFPLRSGDMLKLSSASRCGTFCGA